MRTYSVVMPETSIANGVATGTLVQIKCGANVVIKLLRAWCKQSSSTTTAMQNIRLQRTSTASTVTSKTPILHDKGDAASGCPGGTSATGVNGTAEGTPGDLILADDFNVLVGWEKIWTPDEAIIVGPNTPYIGLFLPTVPTGLTMSAGITYGEVGS